MNPAPLSRRTFLRSAGVSLALPFLPSLQWRAFAAEKPRAAPRRMVCIMTNMGVLPRNFFPTGTGRGYESTPYLDLLQSRREDLTVFSGLSHPGVDGQHLSERSFLSCAPHPAAGNFRNSISLDQFAAEQIGSQTRYPSLVLAVGKEHNGLLSQTRDGVALPPEQSPAALYRRLFVQGSSAEMRASIEQLRKGGSVLDFVGAEARSVHRDLSARDRERLDQYFTSIRDLEERLLHAEAWERRPKPQPPAGTAPPTDIPDQAEVEAQSNLMFDTMRLALETDSTRLVSVYLGPLLITPRIEGVRNQTHGLTHHGNDEEKIEELTRIELAQFRCLARLLDSLAGVGENGARLLDHTMVLYGSNLSNANSHDTTNLPVLLAGGGFRHGQHLAFDRKNNKPLANVFVSMLQNLGLETDRFASSTGRVSGLERA